MKADLLAIIEAAYAGPKEPDAWLRWLVEIAGPVIDRGLGVLGLRYFVAEDGTVHARGAHGYRMPPMDTERANQALARMAREPGGAEALRKGYGRAPNAGSFFQITGVDPSTSNAANVLPPGAGDGVAMTAGDPSGEGVVLCAFVPARTRLSPRERSLWMHAAAHVAAAYRLVRQESPVVDAVLRPDGRVEHAEPAMHQDARLPKLREATRSRERVRGLRRANPDEALSIWKGLVDGQWSLVDQIDSDGRRYVFAKRNTPQARPWQSLTVRERQVLAYSAEGQPHKLIAYELGVTVATVAGHLKSAARKVGVRSRVELVNAYRAAFLHDGRRVDDGAGSTGGHADDGESPARSPDGGAADGEGHDGGAADGEGHDGGAPDGHAHDGRERDGRERDGREPDGGAAEGGAPDGDGSDDGALDGDDHDGGIPDGGTPGGTLARSSRRGTDGGDGG